MTPEAPTKSQPADPGTYNEDQLLPLSALQHLVFCERRCALVHLEALWSENAFTLEGSHLHEGADEAGARTESRGDLRICRGLPLRSLRLGLSGKADVVEFHRLPAGQPAQGECAAPAGVVLAGAIGHWQPLPVEYKVGHMRHERSYEVQLCAQAICLEEMLGTPVPCGALFYGKAQRRHAVTFDPELRQQTEAAASRLHELIASGVTPRATKEPKCERCSLLPQCLPEAMSPRRSATRYLRDAVHAAVSAKGGEG
ncbi:MAG: CRISPR-associated protein Cas4 [Thermoanaerobaculales bacterium]